MGHASEQDCEGARSQASMRLLLQWALASYRPSLGRADRSIGRHQGQSVIGSDPSRDGTDISLESEITHPHGKASAAVYVHVCSGRSPHGPGEGGRSTTLPRSAGLAAGRAL